MIGQIISHSHVLDKLGGGGMGVGYQSEDTRLKRKVALKFLPPHLSTDAEANQRFIQEAEAASALNHANICTVHDIGQTENGQTFIAMARYEGQTLKQRLEHGALPTDWSRRGPQPGAGTMYLTCTHPAALPPTAKKTPETVYPLCTHQNAFCP